MGKSFYEVLGVAEDASSDDVKRAFRKLGAQLHPDSPGGDEARFKQANEAYQTLSDDGRRAKYDFDRRQVRGLEEMAERVRAARASPPPFDPRSADPMKHINDIFGGLWESHPGSAGAPRKAQTSQGPAPAHERGDDVTIEVVLTVEESMVGCKKVVRVTGPRPTVPCGTCAGSGSQPGTRRVTCGSCAGHGRHVGFNGPLGAGVRTCPSCRGQGTTPLVPCHSCKGTGRTVYARELQITVPAGIAEGQQLRVAGMGTPGHPPGDLYISVKIRAGGDFWREGPDVHVRRQVTMRHAILGGSMHISGPDGSAREVEVPPGTQPGDVVRVRGGGASGPLKGVAGDLVVHIVVQLPKALSARGRKLLEELSEELTRGVPR